MAATQQETPEISLPTFNFPAILEKLILGGIIFILALPLLADSGPWLFPIGRDVIFKLAVELLWVLLIALLLIAPARRRGGEAMRYVAELIKSPIIISLSAFLLIMLISTLTSVQSEFSFWGNIYKNQGLLTWTHYFAFFFLLVAFLKDKAKWNLLIKVSITVASLVSVAAIWQMLEAGFSARPAATLNNSNFLAAYLVLLLPITFGYLGKKCRLSASGIEKWWIASAALLQFLALLFTQTRGGYVGVAIAIFLFSLLYFKPKSPRRAVGAAGTFLAITAIYGAVLFTPLGQSFQQKLPDFTDRFLNAQSIKNASAPRLEAWRTGWHGMLERPLLGYGPENFFVAYDEHYSGFLDKDLTSIELSPWEAWFDKAHNFVFDIGATMGFLGLLAYIAIFASPIWALFSLIRSPHLTITGSGEEIDRGRGMIEIGLIAALAGYLAQNLLGFDTLIPGIYLMLLFAYTSFITSKSKATEAPLSLPRRGTGGEVVKMGLLIFATSIFIVSFKIHSNILQANYELNRAEALANSGRIEAGFDAFEKGLGYNAPPVNPNLRRRYAVIAIKYYNAVEKHCSENADKQRCAWLYDDAKEKLSRALALQKENAAREWPRFTRNYIYAAQIAHILGSYQESDDFFKKALELSPKRISINAEQARLDSARQARLQKLPD